MIHALPPIVHQAAPIPALGGTLQVARLRDLAICCGPDELPMVLAVLRRVVGPVAFRRVERDIMARRAAP